MAAATVPGHDETRDMDPAWKQRICRELRRRDKAQLGNYGKLVESYTRLLDQKEEEKAQRNKLQVGEEIICKEKEDFEQVTCSQMSKSAIDRETLNCSCCTHSQKLREEIETLLNRLRRNEHEYERLLSRVMEEKLEEAEKMNQIYERIKRHQRRKELHK